MATRKPPAAAWKPGQSGNPKGRPPGVGEIGKMRAAIAGNVPAILESLTTAALAGDVQAARLLLERALPPHQARGAVPTPEPARWHPDRTRPRRAGVCGRR